MLRIARVIPAGGCGIFITKNTSRRSCNQHSSRENKIPPDCSAKGAKVENIRGPKLGAISPLSALGGLGVRHSEEIPHAKGAKAAKVERKERKRS